MLTVLEELSSGDSSRSTSSPASQWPLRKLRRHQAARKTEEAAGIRFEFIESQVKSLTQSMRKLEQFFDKDVVHSVQGLVQAEVHRWMRTMASAAATTPPGLGDEIYKEQATVVLRQNPLTTPERTVHEPEVEESPLPGDPAPAVAGRA